METAAGRGRASHLSQSEEEEGKIEAKLPRRPPLSQSSLYSPPAEVEQGEKPLPNSTGKFITYSSKW